MARVTQIEGHTYLVLDRDWEFQEAAASSDPPAAFSAQAQASATWQPAVVPGTVASALRSTAALRLGEQTFDAHDYWFRCPLALPDAAALRLHLGGLATLATVFWNGEPLLRSDNMFLAHTIDVTKQDRVGELAIHFRSLSTALAAKRPRPRWRTRVVDQQQLRWWRTTLLGRIPPWCPPVAPVGPYRPVYIEACERLVVESANVQARLEGEDGVVRANIQLRGLGAEITAVTLQVGDESTLLDLRPEAKGGGLFTASGALRWRRPPLWWPHTHGPSPLVPVRLLVVTTKGATEVGFGKVGFRSVRVDRDDGAFTVVVNNTAVFCRGACWTPTDLISLGDDTGQLLPTLQAARDAGMNMLRVGGTMIYESDEFYRLCDELGIMVWQDFMFANMDYPVNDEAFAASIAEEAKQFLLRTQLSPSLTVLCGSSEIEQQAAMLGLPKELWTNSFFQGTLPELCRELRPDTFYWPSSPSGGILPFQVDYAVSHYYGVGAYLRPLSDARLSDVRFTSECLGFANVPEDATLEKLLRDGESPLHHPAWKARVPRDAGPGWDFDDIRDHYMAELFRVNPMRLRYSDMGRYLNLARVTSGELMARTIAEWRRAGSRCQGALIWWLRDLWAGAGWGIIDADGRPKAAYYYVKRAMAPIALFITDEGLNGLALHAVNDSAEAMNGEVELNLYRHGEVRVASGKAVLNVPARGATCVRADALFEHFLDTAYAYRFGPPGHDLAVATWRQTTTARLLGEAFHFPLGLPEIRHKDLGLTAQAEIGTSGWQLRLRSTQLAQAVTFELKGFEPEDRYLNLAPGVEKILSLVPSSKETASKSPQGVVVALNAQTPTKILVVSPAV